MNSQIINCVLLPVSHGHLLLPNTAVASMLSFIKPQELDNAPAWLLGMINWQGWYLPLVSWTTVMDTDAREALDNARIAIVKSIQQDSKLPYFAIISQGFPRLISISEKDLEQIDDDPFADSISGAEDCLLARIQWENKTVDLPALPELSAYISKNMH